MKRTLLALSIPYILSAHTMPELFHALKNHSQAKADEMVVKKAEIGAAQASSQLYPTINLFGAYDYTSEPVGMIPVPPNELIDMVQNPSVAQPFSNNTYKVGVNFSMPLFVKSIFTYADKARVMQKSAKIKKRLNLLKNEALIVGSNANLKYLTELMNSLNLKEKSLLETEKTLHIKVRNGRSPASALYKIDDALNQISITKNTLALEKNKVVSSIEILTGITLSEAVEMQEAQTYSESELASLQPLKEKIRANKLGVKAEKEKLYPSVVAHGSYAYSTGKAYNIDENVNETYGSVGILINIPLLQLSQYEAISASKIELQSNKVELQKLTDELSAKATMLQTDLPLYENSIKLSHKSVENKIKLLEIAKVNYRSGRLSTEEYLRYEDDVVSAKAKLYLAKAQKWQTLMELAVIYANNIEEMIK